MKKKVLIALVLIFVLSVSAHAFLFGKKEEIIPVPMTLEELAQFDGKEGRPAYVAVNGLVYDLTKCRYWKAGIHVKSPEEGIAGRDMTELLKRSQHGMKRVKGYPQVGYIVGKE